MRKILFIVLALLATTHITAQEIKVKSMEWLQNDLYARTHPRTNADGVECALVRIVVPMVKDIQFSNTYMIGSQDYIPGEYQVWVFPGAKKLTFRHENFPSGDIVFADYLKDETGAPMPVEGKNVYRIVLDVPTIATTFEDLYAIGKDYIDNKNAHTDFGYFEAAQLALKAAFEHNDCPAATREEIREQRDSILSIRNQIYRAEHADKRARQAEAEQGFQSDEVYKRLGAEVNFFTSILRYHPEMTAIQTLRDQIAERLQQHPKGKEVDGTTVVTRQRETLSGTITVKNKYMELDFNRMRIYALSSPSIKGAQSRIVGKVNADGTYHFVKPDGISPLYIYVTGEKDKAHLIPDGTTQYDIVVK